MTVLSGELSSLSEDKINSFMGGNMRMSMMKLYLGQIIRFVDVKNKFVTPCWVQNNYFIPM